MSQGRRFVVRGTVQGVGFRPWVYRIARAAGVGGDVRNGPDGVTIHAFGDPRALDAFEQELRARPPPTAHIRDLQRTEIPGRDVEGFVIKPSEDRGERELSIPPDLATCSACAAEVLDPGNRRYRYAFTNCTSCGPRFTIATGVPYDRPATTMAAFAMCPACQREYDTPTDRRFHAQPNACPVCGPKLWLAGSRGQRRATADPIASAALLIAAGGIAAVKGLGGFHLACDARSAAAVRALRDRKRREHKPFAVMVADLATARRIARLSPAEAQQLVAPERPIVLAQRRPEAEIAGSVAPDTDLVGLFLPYTPLHHLLLAELRRPLVMTSGNRSDEPIAYRNEEAFDRLRGIADGFLLHDRPIAGRCDDSVVRVIAGAPTVLRRSRGYVPRPIPLARPVKHPVLACGAHLKNTFCLVAGDSAYLGPHIGDLETVEAADFLEEAINRMQRLLDIAPAVVAHDLHPGYVSTLYALGRPEPDKVGVQHHHAHIASAMGERGVAGPVIGVAYDGTGYGTDGTAWGGEVMIADLLGYERVATMRPVALPGGDKAIHDVWRIALAAVEDAFDGAPPLAELPVFAVPSPRERDIVHHMLVAGINAPHAHGVGRYFDAVGALVLGRSLARYEGQVAVALEAVADPRAAQPYPFSVHRRATPWEIDLRPTVRAVVGDVIAGVAPAVVAGRFHATLVAATTEVVVSVAAARGVMPVVLTGGCFQNARLTEGLVAALGDRFTLCLHGQVPPGDGGIALGQAVIAAARAEGGL